MVFKYRCMLTLHAAAARLEHPGVHVGLGVGEKLVSSQICVVRGSDEVVTQRLLHVLIHLMVQRVENVTRWTAHETCKTWGEIQIYEKKIVKVVGWSTILLKTEMSTIGWIVMKFWTDIHACQRINPTDVGEFLSIATMRLTFFLFIEMSGQLSDGLPCHLV